MNRLAGRLVIAALGAAVVLAPSSAAAQPGHESHGNRPSREAPRGASSAAGSQLGFRTPPPAGPSRPASELQALVGTTPVGGTVHVPPGRFLGSLTVDRAVIVDGHGLAVLDAGRRGTVVRVTAGGAVVRGLHVTGSGRGVEGEPTCIRVEASKVRIENNTLTECRQGIDVMGGSGIVISGNSIRGDALGIDATAAAGHLRGGTPAPASAGIGHGIYVWRADAVTVRLNVIERVLDGVFVTHSRDLLLDTNQATDVRFGVHLMYTTDTTVFANRFDRGHAGLVLMYSRDLQVGRNVVQRMSSPATGFGVLLKNVDDILIAENLVRATRVGLTFDSVGLEGRADVRGNRVEGNDVGVSFLPETAAVFSGNSFARNAEAVQAQAPGRNLWTARGFGNHWGQDCLDLDRDGVCDTPFRLPATLGAVLGAESPLRVLASSPARQSLDAVWAWFAGSQPLVVDDRPLAAPPDLPLPASSPPSGGGIPIRLGSLAMALLPAGGLVWVGRRSPR